MVDEHMVNRVLDCRGLFCPLPLVKLNKEMKKMEPSEFIKVLATDPGSKRDFDSWCKKTGNKLLEIFEDNGLFTFIIQKTS